MCGGDLLPIAKIAAQIVSGQTTRRVHSRSCDSQFAPVAGFDHSSETRVRIGRRRSHDGPASGRPARQEEFRCTSCESVLDLYR